MYSFTRINFQTFVEFWSGKTASYPILKVVKKFLIDQITSIQLDVKVVDCVINDYLRDKKGYELLVVNLCLISIPQTF